MEPYGFQRRSIREGRAQNLRGKDSGNGGRARVRLSSIMVHTRTTKVAAAPAALKPTGLRSTSQGSAVTAGLARDRKRFLRFLLAKLDDAELAEEILQVAYLKSLQKAGAIRDGESAVAWFYRVLRNALVDHHRTCRLDQRHI